MKIPGDAASRRRLVSPVCALGLSPPAVGLGRVAGALLAHCGEVTSSVPPGPRLPSFPEGLPPTLPAGRIPPTLRKVFSLRSLSLFFVSLLAQDRVFRNLLEVADGPQQA